MDEHAALFIEANAARAGSGRITLAVSGLDALLERLTAQRIEHETIEACSNGVRHVKVPDPDGNAIVRRTARGMTEVSIQPFTQAHLDGLIALVAAEGWTEYTDDAERTYRALSAPGVTTLVALADSLGFRLTRDALEDVEEADRG
jgi:hypothetical protein